MYRRDHIHKKSKQTKNNKLLKEYKRSRNKVFYEIRKAKHNYFSDEICNNTNLKKMRRAIGTLTWLINTQKSTVVHGISAETFNGYFTNIGSDLTNNLTNDVCYIGLYQIRLTGLSFTKFLKMQFTRMYLNFLLIPSKMYLHLILSF